MPGKTMSSETTSKSLFEEASEAWDRGEVDIAHKLFQQGAKGGDESCQLNLGYFYDEGIAGEKNKKKAVYWYRKAYKAGSSSAASNIGTVYRDAKDYKRALWWFRRGLAMGDYDALLEIGKLYEKGLGIKKNPKKARSYYTEILSVAEELVTEDTREQATKRLKT
jgi:TPR repeat protein